MAEMEVSPQEEMANPQGTKVFAVCFNEMALFGPFTALIKGCSSYGRNGGQSTGGDG